MKLLFTCHLFKKGYIMADVLIVGDGPAGLSAALFLAKNDMSVTVFGQDTTPMHKAMLYNYLGIPEMTGSDFQKTSAVFPENISKYFPLFFDDDDDDLRLIFKPDLFIKTKELNDYRKFELI